MGNDENKPQSGIESAKKSKKEQESNLSPTAQLVNRMVTDYIMPVLREDGLVERANKIIKNRLNSSDEEVIDFALACRQRQSEIHARAEKEGKNAKELAVVANYFPGVIRCAESSVATPNATVAGNQNSVATNPQVVSQSENV